MNTLKIAVLGTRGFPDIQGGVERHCEELYTRLASMGCKVRVYARKKYVEKNPSNFKGVTIFPLWSPKTKSLEAIVHTFLGIIHIAINRRKFDIVHIHAIGPSLLMPLVRMIGLKGVMTHHGQDYNRQKWGSIASFTLRVGEVCGTYFASSVISVSRHIKESLEKKDLTSLYIPNGVVIPKRIPAGQGIAKYGLEKSMYILAVGRLVPEKGFHDLLEAFKGIDTVWKLVIAGGADHETEYSLSIKKQAKYNHRVIMAGVLTGDIFAEIYTNAGLFVLPSYHEGLPISILEAMSYDLPILASNISANMELIEDEDNTFAPGDIITMRQKISENINNIKQKGNTTNNSVRIAAEFNWDKIAKKTMAVYKRLNHDDKKDIKKD